MNWDWNAIVEDLGPRLHRYFRARFSAEEASDLTQESLIRLVRKLREGAYQVERGNLRMYAFGIARFVALEARPSALPPAEVSAAEPPLVAAAPDEALIGRQRAEVAREAIRRLPEIHQEILSLIIDEEMSLADISILVGLSVGTVKSHIFRAKARLREILIHEKDAQ